MATPASHASLSACLTSRSCFARATPAFNPSMSASIFARTAVQFLTAVSPADLISCFTFSVAFAAAARACSLRASILSCASFSAAATASSVFLARTDKSASCWESALAMHFLHREPTGHEYGWQLPRQRQPRKQRRVPTRTKFFGASECSPLSPDPLEEANPAEGPGPREARSTTPRRNPTLATSARSWAERPLIGLLADVATVLRLINLRAP